MRGKIEMCASAVIMHGRSQLTSPEILTDCNGIWQACGGVWLKCFGTFRFCLQSDSNSVTLYCMEIHLHFYVRFERNSRWLVVTKCIANGSCREI